MGRKPTDLKNIIATHAHRSHIGGMAVLKELTNARVYAHEWEIGIVEGQRKSTRVSIWPKPPLKAYYTQFGLALGFDGHKPCLVDQALKEGDHVGPLTIVASPGHTPGCLSFYWPQKKALFVGDVVVTWPYVEAGWPGLTMDMKENVKSIGKLSDFGDIDIVGVGHGEPIAEGGIEVLKKLRAESDHQIARTGTPSCYAKTFSGSPPFGAFLFRLPLHAGMRQQSAFWGHLY